MLYSFRTLANGLLFFPCEARWGSTHRVTLSHLLIALVASGFGAAPFGFTTEQLSNGLPIPYVYLTEMSLEQFLPSQNCFGMNSVITVPNGNLIILALYGRNLKELS